MTIPNPEDELGFRELVTIRKFRDLPEALLAKGRLESCGVESFLADDNMVHMDWLISNLLGGVKLKVEAADVDSAEEILNQPIPDDFDSIDPDDIDDERRILQFKIKDAPER